MPPAMVASPLARMIDDGCKLTLPGLRDTLGDAADVPERRAPRASILPDRRPSHRPRRNVGNVTDLTLAAYPACHGDEFSRCVEVLTRRGKPPTRQRIEILTTV